MRIATPHVFPKARRVLLHTGVHAEPSHQRNKLRSGRHATETLHKVATTWQKETGEGAAKEHQRRRSAKGKYARWEEREGGSENNEFTTGTCLDALQNESYLPAMIAALHGLIAPANVTKGYADHEFVIGSLNDLSARSTYPYSPMTAASSRR